MFVGKCSDNILILEISLLDVLVKKDTTPFLEPVTGDVIRHNAH